jgi:hypothetical protein
MSLIQYKFKNCNDTLITEDSWSDGYFISEQNGKNVLEFHWKYPNKDDLEYVFIYSERFVLSNGLKIGMSISEIEKILGKI